MGKFYNGSLIALFLISVTSLVLHFIGKNPTANIPKSNVGKENLRVMPIAYFDPDSILNNYEFSKSIQLELEKATTEADKEIAKLQSTFDAKNQEFQRKAQAGMSQQEQESGMLELNKMRQEFSEKRENAIANLQRQKQKLEIDLKKSIQDFLVKYNTPQRFSYIIADEPGFIYYRDTTLNITSDILLGLNAEYKKNK